MATHTTSRPPSAAAPSSLNNNSSPPLPLNLPVPELNHEFNSSTSFKKIEEVKKGLRIAGFRNNYRALHEQKIHGREVLLVNDPGLHMTWKDDAMFLKPLPFDLTLSQVESGGFDERARGYLYSYSKLIQTPLDLEQARDLKLLPFEIVRDKDLNILDFWNTWSEWRDAIGKLDHNYHDRYIYGELRISRLNFLQFVRSFPKGGHFFNAKPRHNEYWDAYTKWAVLVFAFLSVMLSAMQVSSSAGTPPDWFLTQCRQFGYAAIVLVMFALISAISFFASWVLSQIIGWLVAQMFPKKTVSKVS